MIPIKDNVPTEKTPVLTISFIIVNIFIFLYEISLPDFAFVKFIHKYGLLPIDIIYLNWEKILTSMFLHGSFAHLFGNMLFLWIFGNNVEDALGRFKFIVFYILCGVGAAVTQSFISLAFGNISTPMIGASGAISGIMAAYVKLYPEARILTIIPPFFFFGFILPAWFFVGYWFLIQVLFAVATPPTVGGVAWYAHVGGFITGWILINIMYTPKKVKIVHYSTVR